MEQLCSRKAGGGLELSVSGLCCRRAAVIWEEALGNDHRGVGYSQGTLSRPLRRDKALGWQYLHEARQVESFGTLESEFHPGLRCLCV